VQQRLAAVSDVARPVLREAAVVGRRIDAVLLMAMHEGGADLVASALAAAVDVAVLERHEGALRFSHDKLREGLLLELDPEERKRIHVSVAETMERLHGRDLSRAAELAFHFRAAGLADKELQHARIAGEQALASSAYEEASELLSRALTLAAKAPPIDRARIRHSLGKVRFFLMDFEGAVEHLGLVGAMLGFGAPSSGPWRVFALLWQLLVQVVRRLFPRAFIVADAAEREARMEASRAAARLSNVHIYDNDALGLLLHSLVAVNLAESAGGTSVLSLAFLGFAAGAARFEGVAARYFQRMHEGAIAGGEATELTTGIVAEASYLIGVGKLEAAEATLEHNVDLCSRYGDPLNGAYTQYMLALCAWYRGNVSSAAFRTHSAWEGLDPSQARHGVAFAIHEALAHVTIGRIDDARHVLLTCEPRFASFDRLPRAIWHGVMAMCNARDGNVAAALASAHEADSRVATARVVAASGAGLLAGVAEANLLAWRNAQETESGDVRSAEASTRAALKKLGRDWAHVYPIGWPQTLLYEGEAEWLAGDKQKARARFQEALAWSEKLGLGLFQGLAHLALGKCADEGSPTRTLHLTHAHRRFARQGLQNFVDEIVALESSLADAEAADEAEGDSLRI